MKNIKDYMQFYDETLGWTECFKKAVDELDEEGGGALIVPAGVYDTCSVELKSNITLWLEAGAELRFIPQKELYKVIDCEFEGKPGKMYMPCIYAYQAENVSVAGYGTLNGMGEYWWKKENRISVFRPYLICFHKCRRVKVLDVTLCNSPVWTVHPLYCDDVEVRGVTICNPPDSVNTDGINPDSSRNVRIADCLIDVGDDCIAIKAGTEQTPEKAACENITVTNCNMVHGHGGVVIGSEMSGGVRNVVITNCVFQDTDRGIRVKTRRGRGGIMESITVNNIIMDRVLCPFVFNMYYMCGAEGSAYKEKTPHEIDSYTPEIRNIHIQNCTVTNVRAAAGFFYGLPEMPIENVTLSDCTVQMDPEANEGMPAMLEDFRPVSGEGVFMRFAKNAVFRNVQVEGTKSPNREVWNVDDTVDYKILG